MDLVRHHVAHGLVDQPVPLQRRQSAKVLGHDRDREVPAPGRCAGMTRVQVRVVADVNVLCRQGLLEAGTDGVDTAHGQAGRVFLKGLTVTLR